ncbi:sensor histidine kinase [Patescibacteria group bacterium]|nr:MAG: sensor histidine kinase [Patescibacteria group bacterium]
MVIDFYSILPLTCAIFVASFGLFILVKDLRSRMNQLLFGFSMSMFFWMFGTFMMFATRGDLAASVFWDRFVYAGVVFMPPFMHHFSLLFTKKIGKQKFLLFLNYFLAFVFLFASRTEYFVDGLYYYSWGVHTQARILHHLFLAWFFWGTGLFFVNMMNFYRKSADALAKLQTKYVFVAFGCVIFVGGSAYLFAYGIDTKFPFSYVSGLVFPIMLFYTVSRHHLLNTKVITTEVLVGLTEFLLVMQIFFSKSAFDIFVRVVFSLIVALIGVLLIQSVRREIKRREEVASLAFSLEKANIRLKELDQQKTEFLSIASHQLRTPLTVLKGYVELVMDGAYGKPTAGIRKVMGDIDTSNEHLVKLIDEFLDISRIEQGRAKYNFVGADMVKIVGGIVNELQEKAKAKKLRLTWDPDGVKEKICVDEEKIRHVIFNFVDNAIKYSDKGAIQVLLERDDGGLTVRVRDSGIGFGKIDEASFFQKFYRGENVKAKNVTGTGLGLYVCRKFIEAHGGRIWAASQGLGAGSEFGFWVPNKRKPEAPGLNPQNVNVSCGVGR